jgi:hypothetical protein
MGKIMLVSNGLALTSFTPMPCALRPSGLPRPAWCAGVLLLTCCGGPSPRLGQVLAADAADISSPDIPPDLAVADLPAVGLPLPTTCTLASGAWQALDHSGAFVDLTLQLDGTLAALQADGIAFYDQQGKKIGTLALQATSTRLRRLAPLAGGGWLLQEGGPGPTPDPYVDSPGQASGRLLAVQASGKLAWQVVPSSGKFWPMSGVPLADGGALVAGAADFPNWTGQLRRFDKAGKVTQTIPWPQTRLAHAVVTRSDGGWCAIGDVLGSYEAEIRLACWSPTGELTWQWTMDGGDGSRFGLGIWPDNRLLIHANVRTGAQEYNETETYFTLAPPADVSTTLFALDGKQKYYDHVLHYELTWAHAPTPAGGLVVIREANDQDKDSVSWTTTWERYSAKGAREVAVQLDAYHNDDSHPEQTGIGASPRTVVLLPDGGSVVAGGAILDGPFTEFGWLLYLPPISCSGD